MHSKHSLAHWINSKSKWFSLCDCNLNHCSSVFMNFNSLICMYQVFNPSHSSLYSLTYIHIHAFTREPLTHLIDNSERRICASIQRAESEADEMINCQTEWMNEWVNEWIRLTTCCMMAQHRPPLPLPLPLSLSLGFYSEWMRLMRLRLLLLLLLHCSPALHFTHTPPLGRLWHNADDIPMGLGKLPVRANGGPN